jgi:hypothetical protein
VTLADVLDRISEYENDLVIFAEAQPAWSEHSSASMLPVSSDIPAPEEIAGMRYLVEVGLAKEVIRIWSAWREGKLPTQREKCDAVIFYADYDSYQPV